MSFPQLKIQNLEIEKYLNVLVVSTGKLRPYFHAHEITDLTDQPLKNFLQKADASGRMITWDIESSELNKILPPAHLLRVKLFSILS